MTLAEKKLAPDFVVNETLAAAIRERLQGGKLPCAVAFAIAEEQQVSPLLVGQTADYLPVHLNRCQLGLFGYGAEEKALLVEQLAARPIPAGLEAALQAALTAEGQLTCQDAWELADRFHVPRALFGYLADTLGVRITGCQLGAF